MGICPRLRFLKCYIFIKCLLCLRFGFRGQSASLECDCISLWKKTCQRLANSLLVCCCTTPRSVQTSEIILFTRKPEVEKHANSFTASLNLLLLQQVYLLTSLLVFISFFYFIEALTFCRRSYLKPNGWIKTKSMNFSQLGFSRHCQMYKFTSPVQQTKLFVMPNMDDGHPSVPMSILEEDTNTNHAPSSGGEKFLSKWSPPRYLWRGLSVFVLAGQVIIRSLMGKIHWRNTLQQLERVGPRSVGVCLLTSAFVGMAFTIQFVREFTRLGLNRSIGGVLALAFSRELSPVVTSIVVAGRIGSAFAAELGTMQVSEQIDTLRVLGADPVDYLVIPRVIASCLALPFLTLMCFTVGMASSGLLADSVYGISLNIILDSAQRALNSWDLISAMIKSGVFGAIISIVSCAWGVTTMGGAKGVGESTTSAVVISLVGIFIADFVLSYCFFQGAGDSLKNCV